jgi:hypothetical protein
MVNPIADYNHTTGCAAITGAAFVPNNVWPAQWNDHYLFGDFICGQIFDLVATGGGRYAIQPFGSVGRGGPVAMAFGPDGAGQSLYYTTYAGGGQLRVIRYTG